MYISLFYMRITDFRHWNKAVADPGLCEGGRFLLSKEHRNAEAVAGWDTLRMAGWDTLRKFWNISLEMVS